MEYYCSSPKCRNECGHKEYKEDDRERMWRDPESFEGLLIIYAPFCDDEGEIKKVQEYF